MKDFVSGASVLTLRHTNKKDAYRYIQAVAVSHCYIRLPKPSKGIVRAYLGCVTGYSPAQLSRLLGQYKDSGKIKLAKRTQPTFKTKYTDEDVCLLAKIDEAHERLSGPATKVLIERAYVEFGDKRHERLHHISVSHLYNIRGTDYYNRRIHHYTKTKSANIPIGIRSKPVTNGCPGCIRVDSVHQGDKDGEKGVYHINLVDEVTQYEVVVTVEGISERCMIEALKAAMAAFPFKILSFHADNGSEYINYKVADLLKRLQVKLTKSRPRHSGDNGLVETKNGVVIRKALGYMHIPRTAHNVELINNWHREWFVPYLNFHRPCAFRKTVVNLKTGKRKHTYPQDCYQTPYDKLKSLDDAEQYLKPNVTFEKLDKQAYAKSDTEWALATNKAKSKLWQSLNLNN